MKRTYEPTEADRLTGENVRRLRRLTGETLVEVIEGSGIGIKQSSLSRIELGQRALTMPEATKLAAYWNCTPGDLYKLPAPTLNPKFGKVETEQEYLGNPPALFAVPDTDAAFENAIDHAADRLVVIERDKPLTPEQYREQVWVPYLEARYAADTA